MARTHRSGFTLVELLVVIGIIALLIGILLPSLSRARMNARRIQDLSNIRQMALATVNYAATAKGCYPVGTKGYYNEDLAWVNNTLADYLIQFCNSNSNVWTDLNANPQLGRVLCCNAEFDNAKGFGLLITADYYANEEQLGWVYWGGRYYNSWNMYDPAFSGFKVAPTVTIFNRDGTKGANYLMPLRQGDHPTTRTLFTCYSYMSGQYGGIVPHQVNGSAIAATVNATGPLPVYQTDGRHVHGLHRRERAVRARRRHGSRRRRQLVLLRRQGQQLTARLPRFFRRGSRGSTACGSPLPVSDGTPQGAGCGAFPQALASRFFSPKVR